MSVHVTSPVWKLTKEHGITAPQKSMLVKMGDCAWDDGSHSYPKVETIARETCLSERTVQNNLRKLEERKILLIQKPATNKFPTIYQFNMKLINALIRGESQDARGEADAPPGVQETTARGAAPAPKPVLNHQEETLRTIPPAAESSVEDPYLSPDTLEEIVEDYAIDGTPIDHETSMDESAGWRYPKGEMCTKIFNDRRKKIFKSKREKSVWTKVDIALKIEQITEEWVWHMHELAQDKRRAYVFRWNWITFCTYVASLEKYREWDIRHHTRDQGENAQVDDSDLDIVRAAYGGPK